MDSQFNIGDEVVCFNELKYAGIYFNKRYVINDVCNVTDTIKIDGYEGWLAMSRFQKSTSDNTSARIYQHELPAPNHYSAGGKDTLPFIRAKLTADQYRGFILGNIIKYASRLNHKHDDCLEDSRKLKDYADILYSESQAQDTSLQGTG